MEIPDDKKVDLVLEEGQAYVLLREDVGDYFRGLIVKSNKDGSYEVAYWYNKIEPYPIEIVIDGESVSKDAKVVRFNFHPEIDTQKSALSSEAFTKLKSMVEKAPGDRISSTPAPKKDRIRGSKRNKPGSAKNQSGSIKVSATTEKTLRNKLKEHNEKMKKADKPKWSKATLAKLKAVYRRGAGAFSVSHRPGMARAQWANARVNAFLYLLRNGRPKDKKYITDNDLLPAGHPKKSKA